MDLKKILFFLVIVSTACSQAEPTPTIVVEATPIWSSFTPTQLPPTSTQTPIPLPTPSSIPTVTPEPTKTSLPTPTATETPFQPMTLEGEQLQEVLERLPIDNLWVPDGSGEMKKLIVDDLEFWQTEGDHFVRAYDQEGQLVLFVEYPGGLAQRTFGVGSVDQGRLFKVIAVYQLDTPKECRALGEGANCLAYKSTVIRLLETNQLENWEVDTYTSTFESLDEWIQGANTEKPAEIIEAAILQGLALINETTPSNIVESLQDGELLNLINADRSETILHPNSEIIIATQDPATIDSMSNASGLAYTQTSIGGNLISRVGRWHYSYENIVASYTLVWDIASPFLHRLSLQGAMPVVAILYGKHGNNRLFIFRELDLFSGSLR